MPARKEVLIVQVGDDPAEYEVHRNRKIVRGGMTESAATRLAKEIRQPGDGLFLVELDGYRTDLTRIR